MTARESIPAPLRLELSGPTALHAAVAGARSFAERAGIDEGSRSRIVIVIEELVANLYDHGKLGADDSFELQLSTEDGDLKVTLIAPGQEFDPCTAPTQSETGAGAGLKMVRAWSSNIEHDYADGRNRVMLTMPIG